MTSLAPLGLAFISGFIALSYEIVWFRALSMAMTGRAQAFGVLLGSYLFGLAVGSVISRRLCTGSTDERILQALAGALAIANVFGFLVVPSLAWLMTTPHPWLPAVAVLAAATAGLGAVFPLVAHVSIHRASAVGPPVSRIYVANILGSAAGSLGTGLFLMDHLTLPAITMCIGMLGIGTAGVLWSTQRRARFSMAPLIVMAGIAVAMMRLSKPLFADTYERLTFRNEYVPEKHFAHVVENRAGVITATADGKLYGSGLYDGAFNVQLQHDDRNLIRRAYTLGALHPAPKRVLMIGLASGSWAAVIMNHPLVEHLTIVEINPGYLQLLPFYPEVSQVTANSKVLVDIDDGRRWLQRHSGATFDVIVANTTYDWRANAATLLSTGFLQLIREHLNRGGVYYYNTSGEGRVQRTGATIFPFAWQLRTMLAVSDTPFAPDLTRLRQQLIEYRLNGAPALSLDEPGGPRLLERILTEIRDELEPRDQILRRTTGLELITDDNMGTEWHLPRAFWKYYDSRETNQSGK